MRVNFSRSHKAARPFTRQYKISSAREWYLLESGSEDEMVNEAEEDEEESEEEGKEGPLRVEIKT